MGSHITQHLIKLTWIWKGFPDRSMSGKVVNLAGWRDFLKSRWWYYMWQLLFCLDFKYHGCLGTIRMNSCQINISATFLGCFHPPCICHVGICLKWVAFSYAFIPNPSWPAEMGRFRQHLRHYPLKCFSRDISRRSCSLSLCQSNVLTFSKKQNHNPATSSCLFL